MEEKDCIYSLTSGMREEYEEYVKEDYNQYLHLKKQNTLKYHIKNRHVK